MQMKDPTARALVIAEVGSTHGRSLRAALDAVDVARAAGCDAVKFQYWADPAALAKQRGLADDSAYRTFALPASWLPVLRDAAHEAGLAFLCTAFLKADLPLVGTVVDAVKVSSFEARDIPFIAEAVRFARPGAPLLFSCGKIPPQEVLPHAVTLHHTVVEGLSALERAPVWISPMHCVSQYPTPIEAASLGLISSLLTGYERVPFEPDLIAGYSDHTGAVEAGGFAVMAGAQVIEVHVRLADTDRSNPDWPHSLTPDALREYVRLVRLAEQMR